MVSALGRYWYFLVFGPLLICVGGGLLYTIDEYTSNAKLIGYQIITALGVGSVLQNTISEFPSSPPLPSLLWDVARACTDDYPSQSPSRPISETRTTFLRERESSPLLVRSFFLRIIPAGTY